MTDATLPLSPSGARTRMLGVLGDDRLARLAARGDAAAFAAIYERYLQPLHRYCQTIVGNPEDASDCLQSAMLKAYAALRSSPREIALKPWLYRIAHNESISLLRRRRPQVESNEENMGWAPTAEADAATRERLKQLVSDLRDLPERQRGAIVLRELGGLEVSELAEWLGSSEGAARQTLFQGRRSLQDFAEGRDMDCEDVRKAISDGDGRRFGNRQLRAHLRDCEGCQEFRAGIAARQSDLKVIAPTVPAALAIGLVKSFFGGGGAGGAGAGMTGAGGAAAAKGFGGAAAGAKAAAAVAATVVVAGGAAGIGTVIRSDGEERPSGQQAAQPQAPVLDGPPPGSSAGTGDRAPGGGESEGSPKRGSGDREARSGSETSDVQLGTSSQAPVATPADTSPAEGVTSEAPVPAAFTAPSRDLGLVTPPPASFTPVADRPAPRGNDRRGDRDCVEDGDVQAAHSSRGCRSDCRSSSEREDRGRGRGRSRGGERCEADEPERGQGREDGDNGGRSRAEQRKDERKKKKDDEAREREEKGKEDGKEDEENRNRENDDDDDEGNGGEKQGQGNQENEAKGRSSGGQAPWSPAPSAAAGEPGPQGNPAPPMSARVLVSAPPPPAPVPAPPPPLAPPPAPAPPPPPPAPAPPPGL